jgi:hypothetical protein
VRILAIGSCFSRDRPELIEGQVKTATLCQQRPDKKRLGKCRMGHPPSPRLRRGRPESSNSKKSQIHGVAHRPAPC